MLERAEALKRKAITTSAVPAPSSTVSAPPPGGEETPVTLPLDTEQPPAYVDLLKTSLVESGGPLNLNPFSSVEEDEDEPVAGTRYTRTTTGTETMSQVTTKAYVHVPPEDVPASASAPRAGKKAPRKQPVSEIRP